MAAAIPERKAAAGEERAGLHGVERPPRDRRRVHQTHGYAGVVGVPGGGGFGIVVGFVVGAWSDYVRITRV